MEHAIREARRGGGAALAGRMLLPLLVLLPACQPLRAVDEAMRRVDVLDRVFEPGRFRPAPAPVAAPEATDPAPLAPEPLLPEPPIEVAAIEAAPRPEILVQPLPDLAAERPAAATPPPAQPGPPDPAARVAALLRQDPWLARFWSELTPAQQRRVASRLPEAEAAITWDRMGLADRVELIHGRGAVSAALRRPGR